MEDVFKNALKTNLEARKSDRRILAAKIQVLDKQINDLEKLISQTPATKAKAKPAPKPKPSNATKSRSKKQS